MLVKLLGTAAGGAFPQWNCACPNCRAIRGGVFQGKARSQAQVAVSGGSNSWFLLGASPDLRGQIESTPELHPRDGFRESPISGVVLLNADIDHILGLLLLRELQPLSVYATRSIRSILTQDNSMFAMLERVPNQVVWTDIVSATPFPLLDPARHDSGISCRAVSLGSHFPGYVSERSRSELTSGESSSGLIVETTAGKRLAYLPAVPQITDYLLSEIESSDVLLFDGTFWDNDELMRVQPSGRTAQDMGHVRVSESLALLAQVKRPRKIYIHINNTNPMLNEAGPEYRQVRNAGWEVAEDGWQFEL
jgi:pyrroloquinoline quinone biosynthesis protein B